MTPWLIGSVFISIIVYIVLFLIINVVYPKWRKQKYILVALLFLGGAIIFSIGVILLVDLRWIIAGSLLLSIAIIGSILGPMIDLLTRHKIRYR